MDRSQRELMRERVFQCGNVHSAFVFALYLHLVMRTRYSEECLYCALMHRSAAYVTHVQDVWNG